MSALEWYAVQLKTISTAKCTGKQGEDGRKLKVTIESYLDKTAAGQVLVTPRAETNSEVEQRAVGEGDLRTGVESPSKELKGDIRLYGFIRQMVSSKSGRAVDSLTELEKVGAVEEIWRAKLKEKDRPEIFHKIVISLNPEIAKEMTEKGVLVDEELERIVGETMQRFQDKFYAGHQLGYVVGIHHARGQILAPILLYPQTDKAKPINLAHGIKIRLPDGTEARVNYPIFIKKTVEELGVEMYACKVSSVRRLFSVAEEYGIQEKLLAEVALRQIQQEMEETNPGAPLDTRALVVRALKLKRQFVKMSDMAVRPYMDMGYEHRINDWMRMTTEEAQANIKNGEALQKQIKKDIQELGLQRTPQEMKARSLSVERRAIIKDAYRAEKLLLGWKSIKWGGNLFKDCSDDRWWTARMEQNDELGDIMERVHTEISFKFREMERPASLPGTTRHATQKKKAIIQQRIAEIQMFRRLRMSETTQELERRRKEKEEQTERLARLRLLSQRNSLNLIDARAKLSPGR